MASVMYNIFKYQDLSEEFRKKYKNIVDIDR